MDFTFFSFLIISLQFGSIVSKVFFAKFFKSLSGEYKKDPMNARAHKGLGDVYHIQKQYKLAIEEYKKAISIDPNDANTYNSLGTIYHLLDGMN